MSEESGSVPGMSSNACAVRVDCHLLEGDVPIHAVDAQGNPLVKGGRFVKVGVEHRQIGWEWVCQMDYEGPFIIICRDETDGVDNPLISIGIGKDSEEQAREQIEWSGFLPREAEVLLKVLQTALAGFS